MAPTEAAAGEASAGDVEGIRMLGAEVAVAEAVGNLVQRMCAIPVEGKVTGLGSAIATY